MSSPDVPLDLASADHAEQDNVTAPEKTHHEGELVVIYYINSF